jgi:hypothetical protein
MAYVRFPFPAFDHKALRGLEWSAPDYLTEDGVTAKAGDGGTFGAFSVKPASGIFDKLGIQGEHCHAVLCTFPAGTRVIGRSYSWWLQRAVIVDSLDPANFNIVADWRTPRPMNTRFGPEDGIELDGGPLYVISCHGLSDRWVGNRTILQNESDGFRILGSAKDDTANFHEFCLTFSWEG